MALSAPSARHALHFSAEPAVAITLEPSALASWIAVVPMPLEPPCTISHSPGLRPPRSNTLFHTVKNVSGTAAACTMSSPAGIGSADVSSAMQYSA